MKATARANRGTAKGFFLAGRSMKWYTVSMTFFSKKKNSDTE